MKALHSLANTLLAAQLTENNGVSENEILLGSILNSSPDCIKILDPEGNLIAMNENGFKQSDKTKIEDCFKEPWVSSWLGEAYEKAQSALTLALQGETSSFDAQWISKGGESTWWEVFVIPIAGKDNTIQKILTVSRDITKRKISEIIIEGQKQAFELAVHGAGLEVILDTISRTMEQQACSKLYSSICLLESDGNHLRYGAAPSLPKEYLQQTSGMMIGASAGSCGTAAFTGQEVIVADIENHPFWQGFKNHALAAGLKACWSKPILSSKGKILGTFAVYYPEIGEPSDQEREVVEFLSHTAAIVIEREREDLERARVSKEIVKSERRFRDKIDTMAQMIWVTGPDGYHEYFNKRWYEFTGMPAGSTDGELWNEMFHEDDRLIAWEKWNHSLATGDLYEIEYRLRRNDGVYCWVLGRALPIRDDKGAILKWVGSCTLIEDQKQLQRDLELAKKKAEEANIAKTEFLTNMSHEIRTPMNAVIGIANILADMPSMTTQQKEFTHTLQVSANTLLGLINDLLDIAKIESGNWELERTTFSFDQVLEEVVNILAIKAAEKGLAFTCNTSASFKEKSFLGDPTRIRQILMNLCSNAIKFTEKGFVRIDVKCTPAQKSGYEQICLEVADSGVGISEDKIDIIFQKFIQADSSINRKYGGTGLGLAITKTLIESMGGNITVKSKPDEGAVFRITLPLEQVLLQKTPSAIAPEKEIAPLGDDGRRKRVLLVEDYAPNVMVAEIFLNQFGYDCEAVNNGVEAVERYKKGGIDAILMDVQMHGMNGLDSTRAIREIENSAKTGKRIPIIGMTAHAISGDKERCLESGMDDYISKPYEPNDLRQKLKKALS